ncbi:uncharacterized protein LOC107614021 isoform X2 [Arachis ipaensis]|uniref:uncharacterized protein LOC107614021 isoform X2 n=1 Tax=Arachis ipaensis TaxID=130454 RepID=UPI000A2B5A4D|nr:uncharacterized protein LOC107614021 isoform X2 [Arachis ipaensis]XP_020964913.1 uncharacterized protein LOC107614021 isoform X2 [Arachis ipaensis]XP_020964914.1 uncharacterized protein LOC107614021 isoform X2 [Arachis ipaensis]XP_020964915.1 uncharacterized protein LOC107614021 isoform X2 [Arachis ipaensis]XP_020964916.1 uncharacterized protein LOC107614021 isoform X2 [Arachis ipaensis]XP_020964917.1 uncharacterized protein LOC107614021 isoform X2 [Arachis ipaensis]XP_020964918.1 uncharac
MHVMLFFLRKHNFCLPVLVPSRDPKSCESRNPICSKPTPAFKNYLFFSCAVVFGFRDKILLGVMDDDLLLMVRSGFVVAAVPVLENVSIPTVKKTKEVY